MSTQTQPPPQYTPEMPAPAQQAHTGGQEVLGYPVPRQNTSWLPLLAVLAVLGAPILFATMNTVTGIGIPLLIFYGLATLFDRYLAVDVVKRHLSQKEKVLIAIVATVLLGGIIAIATSW